MTKQLTLSDFLGEQLGDALNGPAITSLLLEIAGICTKISTLTSKGALVDIMAKLESQNIQGETQTKLDVITNDLFINELSRCDLVAGLASEELDEVTSIRAAKYLVIFDPLDGSSNAPINVSVGTIFSVLNAPKDRIPAEPDYLQAGKDQVAAGYALYGPSTMLVVTLGKGTHGFTLDPDKQIFILTHPNMRVADSATEFAINASNERFWEPPVTRYIAECKEGATGARERDFNMRWVASMVADIHRILMRGGVYLYPKDNKKPIKAGRLRLMYEANPMSMLVEQAGGKSSTGRECILDIVPENIHQRVPVIIGTSQEVALVERYTKAYDLGEGQEDILPFFGERSLFHKKQ